MASNMSTITPILRQGDREGQGASTRPRRRRTSCVWEFFVLIRPAAASTGAQDTALCPTCLKELTAGSTSHLRRHRCYRYRERLITNQAPAAVPLPAAPAPPPASPVIAAGVVVDDDVFFDLGDIVTIDDDERSYS